MPSCFDEIGTAKDSGWHRATKVPEDQLFTLIGAQLASSDFIFWYSGIVAGIKIKPSIIEPNFPRSMIRSPRLFSERSLMSDRRMRFLYGNQAPRMRLSMKSYPMVTVIFGCEGMNETKISTVARATGTKRASIRGWWGECKMAFPTDQAIKAKSPNAQNQVTLFTKVALGWLS